MKYLTILFTVIVVFTMSSCHNHKKIHSESIKWGTFEDTTLKISLCNVSSFKIGKYIKKSPEKFSFLNDVNIYFLRYMSDGLLVTGFLVKPKKEGNYPCVLFNRGGNREYGSLLVGSAVINMAPLAAKGYVVAATNYRGNSGSEGKEEFGGKDVNDITNLIESLHFIKSADTSKIGLFCVSRGGMMNYLTLKRKINKIKAVVNIGGMADMDSTIKYHPGIDGVCEDLIPNYIKNKSSARNERSVTHWVDQLPKTPILILHGMKDQHVDYSQIPPFTDSLEKYKIPFKSMSFKEDNHG
ncbi:MAG: prolyl oligopeptidase family serine peptidase, partial [Crocinitomicaceae bacterium]|nr:prolyl oligopeptidase family serine peptidase [Crocinitomicaceae bacterium]